MKSFYIILISSLFCHKMLNAQYIEYSLQNKVQNSELILEGKITSKYSYIKDGLIYTANHIDVCSVIYGNIRPSDEIFVITYGGKIEGEFSSWSHLLTLEENMEGVFFLKKNTAITPNNPPSANLYFDVYGHDQGFISYSKNDKWDFIGNGLFTNLNSADDFINEINTITQQSIITKSCLLEEKRGVVLNVDSIYVEQQNLVIRTGIKGQWSKSYNLERARLDIQFSSAVDISSYDFSLNGLTSILQNNYIISWTQQDSFSAHLNILKDNSSPLYSELNSQISPFLEISFHPSLLTVGVSSVDLAESSYRYGNQVINFNEYAVENNRFTKNYFASPDITSFSPNEVCAGIKADQSSGMPIVDGFVIINGNNFGDIDPSDFHNLIPNDYRV
jgi:hypothetical protein